MEKINVIHFHNGGGGGVLSVIKNLVEHQQSTIIENHIIHTLNQAQIKRFVLPEVKGALSQKLFYYNPKWNFYYTCKQLAKLLPDDKAIIIAHDWLELGMVSNLGLQNPVVLVLHGDYPYYYDLAVKHQNGVNEFITVTQSIAENLKQLLSQKQNHIHYLRFPVPSFKTIYADGITAKKTNLLHIAFVGRLSKDKGANLLPTIDVLLQEQQKQVEWHIAGQLLEEGLQQWLRSKNVHYYGEINNSKIPEILSKAQVLILPSKAEGMPVVIIEAMKLGLVPIVSNIKGGIQELIIDGETGYKINEWQKPEAFVDNILQLLQDHEKLKRIGLKAQNLANELFNPQKNTSSWENIILKSLLHDNSNRQKLKVYGSRLDNPFIPNIVTSKIRTLIN